MSSQTWPTIRSLSADPLSVSEFITYFSSALFHLFIREASLCHSHPHFGASSSEKLSKMAPSKSSTFLSFSAATGCFLLLITLRIIYAWVLSRFSRVWLFVSPWTVTLQGPLSMEFSRQEYWSGLPFSSPEDNIYIYVYLFYISVRCIPLTWR